MKLMTKLENIIMNCTGCNRETANLVANYVLDENNAANEKSIDDVMICPCCGSDKCYKYDDDEVVFNSNGTGHYYIDCHCMECGENFRIYIDFEYFVTRSRIDK